MNINLMPHQLIGCAWMKEQEEGRHFGGVLGDEMYVVVLSAFLYVADPSTSSRRGLGKTVEAIAIALINESNDSNEKTNLVVAPLALLEQWKVRLLFSLPTPVAIPN
jgi:SNF2 family DNA or RNA helicase